MKDCSCLEIYLGLMMHATPPDLGLWPEYLECVASSGSVRL